MHNVCVTASYTAYIDESGDEGFTFLPNEQGSSRWFVISAAVFRVENSKVPIELLRKARTVLGKPDKTPLHFRNLKHEQRVAYVSTFIGAPMRTVSVFVHKPSIAEPERYQAGKYLLYKYVTRLVLERLSWLGADYRKGNDGGDGSMELIFSDRAAMSYTSLQQYLRKLRVQSETSDRIRIDWDVIDPEKVRAVAHEKLAGLQVADAVASSHFYAVHLNKFGHCEPRYAEILQPLAYKSRGRCVGYGHKFWPDLGPLKGQMPHLAAFEG